MSHGGRMMSEWQPKHKEAMRSEDKLKECSSSIKNLQRSCQTPQHSKVNVKCLVTRCSWMNILTLLWRTPKISILFTVFLDMSWLQLWYIWEKSNRKTPMNKARFLFIYFQWTVMQVLVCSTWFSLSQLILLSQMENLACSQGHKIKTTTQYKMQKCRNVSENVPF